MPDISDLYDAGYKIMQIPNMGFSFLVFKNTITNFKGTHICPYRARKHISDILIKNNDIDTLNKLNSGKYFWILVKTNIKNENLDIFKEKTSSSSQFAPAPQPEAPIIIDDTEFMKETGRYIDKNINPYTLANVNLSQMVQAFQYGFRKMRK